MRPLKLCFLGWGNHVHLERWAGYFANAGHDVTILSLGGTGHYPSGVRQHVLRFGERARALADAELRLLLWRLRPDLLHVHWAHFAVRAARVWTGPLVVTAWGSDIYRQDQFTLHQRRALSKALARASFVTCDSDDLAHLISERYGVCTDSIRIVQWGVDLERFAPGPNRLVHELEIEGRPVVFSARSFTPVYNQQTVIDAFAVARKSVPSAFLLMKNYGGNPAYVQAMRDRIASLGMERDCWIVDHVPYERMPDLYRAATATVSIPLSDATPMALLEAMACGSTPLVSDLPSLREWIVDGENGFLVNPTDVDAVADRMVRALTDDAFRLRAAVKNREIVETRASQAVHMQRCEDFYRQAIGKGYARSAVAV